MLNDFQEFMLPLTHDGHNKFYNYDFTVYKYNFSNPCSLNFNTGKINRALEGATTIIKIKKWEAKW